MHSNMTRSAPVTLALTGDVMLGRLMRDVVHAHGPAYPWGDVLPMLRAADMRIINLECVIAANGAPWTRTPKVFHFRADPIAIETLQAAAIDCIVLANNHVLDYEEPALEEMIRRLDKAGISHTGAGHNLTEAFQPALLERQGVRIAVVAFTDNQPEWAATPTSPGVAFVQPGSSGKGVETLMQALDEARSNADVLICSAHWGPNMRQRPPAHFREFAYQLIDRGVDLVHGHSAHIVQGIEIYQGKPILYDVGDFVDDYAVDPTLRNDRSFLFRITIQGGKITSLEMLPTLIHQFQVNPATGEDARETCSTMCRLSAELGTNLEEWDQGLRLSL